MEKFAVIEAAVTFLGFDMETSQFIDVIVSKICRDIHCVLPVVVSFAVGGNYYVGFCGRALAG